MKKIFGFICIVAILCVACNNNQPEADSSVDSTSIVLNTILTRHSVRAYTAQPIGADTIQALLRAAMAAPSGVDVRPWRFVVLTDTAQYDSIFGDNFNLPKYKNAAAVIVVCGQTTWVPRHSGSEPSAYAEVEPNKNWTADVAACAENLLLAAHAYGLGAVWTACYPYEDRMQPVHKALNLPDDVAPFCVIPLGHPAEDVAPKDKWDTACIHYNRW
ncbi:MAG: nitroreductase family protein [Bacteroidales bacterium]|nr:nitroreductase family protein [Candidatus Colimorpha onthohippi]